ncbi:AGE family epimerase/isomerase [Actinomadura sp. ATCC 31491]|uniref:AGE family epimerase/isomerase n=1 Tax=Actinomadura luzonensis TaxID=2805427 RepID=A0ABT0G966_9ACTN|nr:DJ-1/PfpI family protein [Actinomadura luzonensis]MCK2220663.1 AGE family epimerase/isomerase [Actinomadura luzonensis]
MPEKRLAGRTVAILMESDYVEQELHYYQRRFAEEGARVRFLTRLWGQDSLTFHGHEYKLPFTVGDDLESADLSEIDVLIVPSGMVSDRLRYSEEPGGLSPAVRLLRAAFEDRRIVKGIICHGLWLAAPIPESVAGRRVTCHNNLVADARNMGAVYTDQDVVVDRDLVTGRSADHCAEFARMIIDLVAAGAADGTSYRPDYTFSDLVAGYVTGFEHGEIRLRTNDGRPLRVRLTGTTSAEFVRNLGEPYLDASAHLEQLLAPGMYVFVNGIFYFEDGAYTIEAKALTFLGRQPGHYAFEEPDWWVRQIRELGRFYRRAQFADGPIDYAGYRTMLRLGGEKAGQEIQETDTISRLVYGMSSAYMLTGDEDFLEVAERGAAYLREHMRFVDRDEDVVYWYHGVEQRGGTERKLFTSEFGDDYDAIPMYEQIYALAGPTQLYRLTGDPALAADIDGTLRLFRKFFHDPELGGYFSHIDPILLSPHHESLGPNRSRKNWNSVGDHAPAYLINLFLATGDERHADMLEDTFDLIARHMPRKDSPYVQERFHADWTPDTTWHWQQDRAVVGHNLKIAWNLMRMNAIRPKERYRALAAEIGEKMPALGSDPQRGGWYDVVERRLAPGQSVHRFTWHDRKAWWQQEQAILAYQILAGNGAGDGGGAEFLRRARESAAFYSTFFLDHDEGGVYFNVLAGGHPYLQGTERFKGSHSMSMCHAAELCFLATVYQRLLLDRRPLTLWFRPRPDGFTDRVLRVAPDALPPGRVRLEWVEVDGAPYQLFDAAAMTVKLPDAASPVTVRAHLAPVEE